jgi:hypothetical protein
MDIRKDFQSVEPLLHRLAGIGVEFAKLNRDDWPHLKNQEDFGQIYRLPTDQRTDLEELYAKGRDCAYFMSGRLREFNDVGQFPTFAAYVDSFATTWAYEEESLEDFLAGIKQLVKSLEHPPWAIGRMISVFEDQLRLLAAVRHTVSLRPNWSFNRSANGWPPCPRGAVCLSCASRARRPSVVARLTLR